MKKDYPSLLDFIKENVFEKDIEPEFSELFVTYIINEFPYGDGYDVIICEDKSILISCLVDLYGDLEVSYVTSNFIHVFKKIPLSKEPLTLLSTGMCMLDKLRSIRIVRKAYNEIIGE